MCGGAKFLGQSAIGKKAIGVANGWGPEQVAPSMVISTCVVSLFSPR